MELNCVWAGAALDPSGYGEATRGYLLELAKRDHFKLKLINKQFWNGDMPDLRNEWSTLSRLHNTFIDRGDPYVFVQHLTPDVWKLGAGACKYHVGMTTFETDSIPAEWQVNMRSMDELWTFSKWSRQVFEDAGIRREVHVVPHGVDTELFKPDGCKLFEFQPKPFVFGSNFDWTERKNPTALIQAYFMAFKPTDDVCLVLKTYYQFPLSRSREYIIKSIEYIRARMGLQKTPKIYLISDIMPSTALSSFYRSLDAYVLPSRGEGWGLTYSEAMATGLPVIAVNWSGHTEFMGDHNSLLCHDFKLREITKEDCPHQPQYVGHRWADVMVGELAQNMRRLYDDRVLGRMLGLAARETMVNRFSWQEAGKVIDHRLTYTLSM